MALDFAAEGLLDDVEDDEARAARLALLQELHDDGVTLEELRTAVGEGRLALLPVERVLAGEGELHTAAEAAELTGVDEESMRRTTRALGLPWPEDPDERSFSEDDIRGLAASRVFAEAGLPEEARLEVARTIGISMSTVAAAIRAMMRDAFGRQEEESERDVGLRYAEAARHLTPAVAPVLENVLRAHLREQIRQDVVERAADAGELAGSRTIAACFADLVGFTRLGEELPADELGAVARRLAELAGEVIEPPVRLVKTIGDAVMLVSLEPAPLVEAALDLVAAADASELPHLRAGVAVGEAVAYGGDWYGRPINLASRLTSIARPGSVLATEAVRDALPEEGFRFSFAGERRIKGIRGDQKLLRIRRAEPPAEGERVG